MGWVEMSERELRRAEVLASVFAGRLTMTAAAGLMGITRRQAHRLARQFADHGAAGLRHRARGRPSNRGLGPHVRQMAIAYVTENYRDFGPTLASQMLLERHGLRVSRETLRQWMREDGLWLSRERAQDFSVQFRTDQERDSSDGQSAQSQVSFKGLHIRLQKFRAPLQPAMVAYRRPSVTRVPHPHRGPRRKSSGKPFGRRIESQECLRA